MHSDGNGILILTDLIRNRAATTSEMLAVFGDDAYVRAALNFESALARAEAEEGLISIHDADVISENCAALSVNISELAEGAALAGTLAIALIRKLRDQVEQQSESAAKSVHLGATSQDLADTALMLQAKAAGVLIESELERLIAATAMLTEKYAATPMLGRTLLQGALPITFGLKTAGWLTALDEARSRFILEQKHSLILQFGGATGSLAGLHNKAFAIAERLSSLLGLPCPLLPWHARRNGVAGLATSLAIVTGAAGKVARDIALMAQSEIAEVFEPRIAGRGGSSVMPHKRNPTGCQIALSAAMRTPNLAATILFALPQEHERGLGGWQIEASVLAEVYQLAHGAITALVPVVEELDVDTDKMRTNLEAAGVGLDVGESLALTRRALESRRM